MKTANEQDVNPLREMARIAVNVLDLPGRGFRESCRCWHDIDGALHFLDGRTPAETAGLFYSHPVLEPFFAGQFREKYHRQQPDWLAQMHLGVWRHYGRRLFELFDLRRPGLWEEYRMFLKQVYAIEGRVPEIDPPLDVLS